MINIFNYLFNLFLFVFSIIMLKKAFFAKNIDTKLKRNILIQSVLSSLLLLFLIILLFRYKSPNGGSLPKMRTLLTSDKMKKPLTDTRTYEIVKLDNGLMMTLISDPTATRSGFSMTTLLGSNNYLVRYPGISKLLQRKLISKKLRRAILDNGGHSKYVTNEEYSTYYFDIKSEAFETALKEVVTILKSKVKFYDDEGSKDKILYDLKKILGREREQANENVFLDTLVTPGMNRYDEEYINGEGDMVSKIDDILANMKELYNIYFSPQNIKIALISSLDIKRLKRLTSRVFGGLEIKENSEIPNRTTIALENEIKYGQFIWVKPRSIALNRSLKVILYSKEVQFKGLTPLSYFTYLLDGERPDSVMYYLGLQYKQIENAKISIQKSIKYGNKIIIDMKLKRNGDEDMKYIFKVIFGIIYSLKNSNEVEETYNDLRQIYQKKFLYMTIDKYSTYLNDITFNMLNTTNEDYSENYLSNLLYMNYDLPEFNSSLINEYRNDLVVEHSVFLYKTKKLFGTYDLDSIFRGFTADDPLKNKFGINYLNTELNPDDFIEEIQSFGSSYLGKTVNKYLTQLNTLTLTNEEGDIKSIIDDTKAKMWIRKDTTFKVPRIHSYFHFVLPDVRTTEPNTYLKVMNYANYLIYSIILNFEEAKMSGNEVVANIDENGLNIKVSGYKDVYIKIIRKLFQLIYNVVDIDRKSSYNYQEKRYRSLEEKSLNFLANALKPNTLGDYNKGDYQLDADVLRDYFNYNAKHLYLECLLYGDLNDEIVDEMKSMITEVNISDKSDEIEEKFPTQGTMKAISEYLSYEAPIKERSIHVYKLIETFGVDDMYYYITFYQIGVRNNQLDVLSSLLVQVYNEYVGDLIEPLEKVYKDNMIYLRSITHSRRLTPLTLAQDYDTSIDLFIEKLDVLSLEEFTTMFNYVKGDYLKKEMRLRHKAIKYWYEIYERTFNFERSKELQDYVEQISVIEYFKTFISFAKDTVWNKVRKVEFWLYHENDPGVIEDDYPRKVVANVYNYNSFKYINEENN